VKRVFSEDSTGDWDEGTLQSLRWIRFWIRFLRDLSAHLGKRTREDGYDLDFKELPHLVQQQSTAQRFEAAGLSVSGPEDRVHHFSPFSALGSRHDEADCWRPVDRATPTGRLGRGMLQ